MSKTLDDGNGFSLAAISDLRSEAFATIRHRAAEIATISAATESLDVALQSYLARSLSDDQTSLVAAAGKLAAMLPTGGVQ